MRLTPLHREYSWRPPDGLSRHGVQDERPGEVGVLVLDMKRVRVTILLLAAFALAELAFRVGGIGVEGVVSGTLQAVGILTVAAAGWPDR